MGLQLFELRHFAACLANAGGTFVIRLQQSWRSWEEERNLQTCIDFEEWQARGLTRKMLMGDQQSGQYFRRVVPVQERRYGFALTNS